MSKTCYKKGPGSTIMELDIYRDMNLSIDTDCPTGWAENIEETYGYEGPLQCEGGNQDETTTCYRCDGNMRQAVTSCGIRQCPDTYDSYPIKCNYPNLGDAQPPIVVPSYDKQYCACQENDGTVTGYSPLCCSRQLVIDAMATQPYTPAPTQPYTPAPKTAGISSVPWYGWVVIGLGMAYFLKINAKRTK